MLDIIAHRRSRSQCVRSSSQTEIALYREGGRVSSSAILTADGSLTVPAGDGALWVSLTNPQQVLVPVDGANPEVFALQELVLE